MKKTISKNNVVRLYTIPESPACKHVAVFLRSQHIKFEEADVTQPEWKDYLRKNHVFDIEVPILQIYVCFYKRPALFDGDELRTDDILWYLKEDD